MRQEAAKLREMPCQVAWWGQHKVLLHEAPRITQGAAACEERVEGAREVLVLGMARPVLRAAIVLATLLRRSSPEARTLLRFVNVRPQLRRAPAFPETFASAKSADLM